MSGMAETSAWWVTYNAGSSGRTRKNNGPNPITAYVPSLHDPPPDCFGALEKAKASPAYARELEAQREKLRQLHAARKMNSSWQQLAGRRAPDGLGAHRAHARPAPGVGGRGGEGRGGARRGRRRGGGRREGGDRPAREALIVCSCVLLHLLYLSPW